MILKLVRLATPHLGTQLKIPEPTATLEHLVGLLVKFRKNTASLNQLNRLRQLVMLLHKHPEASEEAWKGGIVPMLVDLRECGQMEFEQQARLALALLGWAPPLTGRGIRILSVDGGGTR